MRAHRRQQARAHSTSRPRLLCERVRAPSMRATANISLAGLTQASRRDGGDKSKNINEIDTDERGAKTDRDGEHKRPAVRSLEGCNVASKRRSETAYHLLKRPKDSSSNIEHSIICKDLHTMFYVYSYATISADYHDLLEIISFTICLAINIKVFPNSQLQPRNAHIGGAYKLLALSYKLCSPSLAFGGTSLHGQIHRPADCGLRRP